MQQLRLRSASTIASMAAGVLAISATPALAQDGASISQPMDTGRSAGVVVMPDFSDPALQEQIKHNRALREIERELKRLRFKHFGSIRNVELRQLGIVKLRPYALDVANWALLMEVYEGEESDVRLALLDMFDEHEGAAPDAAFAWFAVHGEKEFRQEARQRLVERSERLERVALPAQRIISAGLKDGRHSIAGASAVTAQALSLYEAIPQMISGIIVETSSGPEQRAIANIYVATQQAFVADLTPVVSDGAVGFDPELAVATDGVVLHILDASVVTYQTQVFGALSGLASEGWGGRSVDHLGYDKGAWRAWYANEFKPYRERLAEEARSAEAAAAAAAPEGEPGEASEADVDPDA